MGIRTRTIEYTDNDTLLEAYMAWDDSSSDPRPAVTVSHTFGGRTEFEESKADLLAQLGYVGIALDVYGKGIRGRSKEHNYELMKPFLDDREMLQRRLTLGIEQAREQEEVDPSRVAAIGYCFGGLCVLDLARTGADVVGVASFHGNPTKPGNTDGNSISARVLILQGWEDPFIPPEQVLTLAEELTEAGADWQIHTYGNTMHSFTDPAANWPDIGAVYNEVADRRSWQSLQVFLEELF